MTGYNLITASIHLSSGNFADFWDFASVIRERYAQLPFDKKIVKEQLRHDIARATSRVEEFDQHAALEFLIARDLDKALMRIDDVPDEGTALRQLNETQIATRDFFSELGLKFSDIDFFVVGQFPEPYAKMDWVAFAPDKSDQENFKITPGVYLLESELTPYYSCLTLAHELVHAVVGTANPYLLGRGLEEGLADLLGALFIGSRLFSPLIARNIFVHTRLGTHSPQSNRLYLDYTRQAYLVYRSFGFKGIAELVRQGRAVIKGVEEHLLEGKIREITLPVGGWEEELTGLLDEVLLGFVPNLVVSPLAAYVATFALPNTTISEIAQKSKVASETVKEVLQEVQDRIFGLLLDHDKIVFSDLSMITKTNSLRYEVTT